MILINSRFEYYNTFYNCVIGKNYVHNGKEECKPFVPKNKSIAYFKINGRLVSIKQVLNERYLVRMNAINGDYIHTTTNVNVYAKMTLIKNLELI